MDIEEREGSKLDENDYGNKRIQKNNVTTYTILIVCVVVVVVIAKGVGLY